MKQQKIINIKSISSKQLKKLIQKDGDIKLLSTGFLNGYTNDKICKNYYENEVITIPTGGTANIKYWNGKFLNSLNNICVSIDKNKFNTKYIYYFLQSNKNFIENCFVGAGIKHPSMKRILDIKIPIPPQEKQKEIVEILDKFDTLVNDLSEGIPAEIEMRTKQYEYYRNKLLTFEEE